MVEGNKEIVKQGYDAIAEKYLTARNEGHPDDIELLQELIKRLPKEAKVLDADCGVRIVWSKIITEQLAFGGGRHLFILVQKD